MIGVSVTLQYHENFDRVRVASIAENARGMFEGMPGLRSKVFTIDEPQRRAMNFYIWDSANAARRFFSEEVRRRLTGLYGVQPTIEFVEIAQIVDNSGAARLYGPHGVVCIRDGSHASAGGAVQRADAAHGSRGDRA